MLTIIINMVFFKFWDGDKEESKMLWISELRLQTADWGTTVQGKPSQIYSYRLLTLLFTFSPYCFIHSTQQICTDCLQYAGHRARYWEWEREEDRQQYNGMGFWRRVSMNNQKRYAKIFEYVGVYNFSEKFWRDS